MQRSSFRHFFIHSYGFSLRWDELRPLVDGIQSKLDLFRNSVKGYIDSLSYPCRRQLHVYSIISKTVEVFARLSAVLVMFYFCILKYRSSTLFLAHGVLLRNCRLDLMLGSLLKHRILMILPSLLHP